MHCLTSGVSENNSPGITHGPSVMPKTAEFPKEFARIRLPEAWQSPCVPTFIQNHGGRREHA